MCDHFEVGLVFLLFWCWYVWTNKTSLLHTLFFLKLHKGVEWFQFPLNKQFHSYILLCLLLVPCRGKNVITGIF